VHMSTQYPPLPYRRLKLMANGLWDEVRKEFYPFISFHSNQSDKVGIPGYHYYIKSVQISAYNVGDNNTGYVSVKIHVGGVERIFVVLTVPATVAASNVNASASTSTEVNLLGDPSASIDVTKAGVTQCYVTVIYAEVPADPGWVVVE